MIALISIVAIASAAFGTLIPVNQKSDLGPIAPHHLVCKTGSGDPIHDTEIFTKVPSIHPELNHELIDGFLCMKVRHTLQCRIGFWGGESLSTYSETIHVHPAECQDAIHDWKDDTLDTTLDLVKQCSWWSTNTVDKDIFEIRKKQVHLDPYNLEFVDPIFLQGRCSLKSCTTKYQGMIWITEHTPKIGCPKLQSSKASLYYRRESTPDTTIVKSDYIPSVSLKGACKDFYYCGFRGLVLRTGHFLPVPESPIIPLSRVLPDLKTCSKGIRVISNNMEAEILIATLNVEQLFMRDKCYESAQKIRSGLNVSDYEISFLTPWASGLHPGFVKRSNKLYVGMFEYLDSQSVDVSCFNCSHCSVTVLSNNAIVRVNQSLISCQCSTPFFGCSLPNGLRVMGRSLLHPWGDIIDDIRLSIFNLDSDPHFIEHPIVNAEQQEEIIRFHGEQGYGTPSNFFDKTADSIDAIIPSTSGLWRYLAWSVFSVILLYVVVKASLLVLRRIFSKNRTKHREDLGRPINQSMDGFVRNQW